MHSDAESILKVCGMGSYLHINCGNGALVLALLKRSINAFGMDASTLLIDQNAQKAPERFFTGTLRQYPFKPAAFDTIIIGPELLDFQPQDMPTVFSTLMQMTKRQLVLYFPHKMATSQRDFLNRLFWEKAAILGGFRRHPREMLVNTYASLENEQMGRFTFFERVPEQANQQFPLSWLLKNRDLHMDMLREAGRRSDAHVSRYVLAAQQIRPGDTVLDAACGLGYGTAVLAACSPGAKFIGVDIDPESTDYANANFAVNDSALSYQTCDVTKLSFLADHSVDIVVSFETIEHVENYDHFLAEIRRVLKPDGRFIGSVPNLWCDETGKDPNPYHYHVFDWQKLQQAISQYFIVDGRYKQLAGGGYKLHDRQRDMQLVPLEDNNPVETEWWIISASANPTSAAALPYHEQLHPKQEHSLDKNSIVKYYDNPWLYRVMIQLGEQLSDRKMLVEFCAKIVQEARVGSADQGAALTVLASQLLSAYPLTENDVFGLIRLINAYEEAVNHDNLHASHWNTTLHYLAGRLLLSIGNRENALTAFLACANLPRTALTPALAVSIAAARFYAGMIFMGNDALDEAKEQFQLAIKEAHRELHQSLEATLNHPEQSPLSSEDTNQLMMITRQCREAVQHLDRHKSAAGYFWEKVNFMPCLISQVLAV
jgi:ubiquinone/menaquinone biosynthesis C-methylase UbiE